MQLSKIQKQSRVMAGIVFILGLFAFAAAFGEDQEVEAQLGGLVIWAAIIEIFHGFRRASSDQRKLAWRSAAFSILLGVFLINSILLLSSALTILVAVSFAADAISYFRHALTEKDERKKWKDWLAVGGNLSVLLLMLLLQKKGLHIAVSIAVGLRIFGIAFNIIAATTGKIDEVSEDLMRSMHLEGNQELSAIAERIEQLEVIRTPFDRYWITTFIIILFFIHLGRMGLDRSFMGVLSPLVAVFGDIVIAMVITYVVIGPVLFAFRRISTPVEMFLWKWVQQIPAGERSKISFRSVVQQILEGRLTGRIRLRKAGYSAVVAIRTGLKTGLPWAALLAAVMPVLGMSWYFDTENWASGVWDTWAAKRADTWRMNMAAVTGIPPSANSFRLKPGGINDSMDFSFVVIGDPGEGDASQLVLKDMILKVTDQPLVKFVVVSSDIIYPSGAMKDYEKKFYMPFKGVTKPVYAIPGNHDWYDALEGFAANFYEPALARKTMQARVDKDLKISSTTDRKINEMISEAAFLRKEYGVPTGFQQAPYFQVSNGVFVLICIDTGVERQLDSLELTWVKSVLKNSKGKFVMALLGHPFYAIGEYQGSMNPAFEKLHQLLREHKVPVVMAGDTHDFEYYKEEARNNDGHVMHHFVNGGGGAYLSIGTALAKEADMPTSDFAFYPGHDPLVKKISDNTAWYKYPAWWYTRQFNGWPFSAEWLSAAFDYNVAPFFQSFMEIRVEQSKHQVRFIPYSQHGRLRWKDITSTIGARMPGSHPDDFVEWSVPMHP
ncbi:metallophosphoesterase [Flavihumibacter fluvii]|uniref:metallophosphoesterase n=1 Tax=Flavihumibacter fluvii TaxID=2838157 RepID=UPI001BDED9D5|nr:metallophosphoesterase [Flavihumibacter fluvii]ULQ54086.1 metallophosphoesterase [Flavihumibacter fluvii]